MWKVFVTDILEHLRSWNNIVVVGTSYGMKCFGFEFQQEKDIFSALKRPDRLWGRSNFSSVDIVCLSRIQQSGCEVDHSPPYSVLMAWTRKISFVCVEYFISLQIDMLISFLSRVYLIIIMAC